MNKLSKIIIAVLNFINYFGFFVLLIKVCYYKLEYNIQPSNIELFMTILLCGAILEDKINNLKDNG